LSPNKGNGVCGRPPPHREIEDLRSSLIRKESDKKNLEASLHGQIKILQKKLQERNVYNELLETTLIDKCKELKNVMEAHGAKIREIRELSDKLEKDTEKYGAESTLCGQKEDYERRLQERDAKCKKERATLNGVIKRLKKQLEENERAKTACESLLHTKTQVLAITMSINHRLLAPQ
jgi:DNA repair exonuclease SbcCD ATPase subunit